MLIDRIRPLQQLEKIGIAKVQVTSEIDYGLLTTRSKNAIIRALRAEQEETGGKTMGKKPFDLRRELAYVNLIERVRKIDPEAAEYLSGPAREVESFTPCGESDAVFHWMTTPQGGLYWHRIMIELIAEKEKS